MTPSLFRLISVVSSGQAKAVGLAWLHPCFSNIQTLFSHYEAHRIHRARKYGVFDGQEYHKVEFLEEGAGDDI